MDVFVDGYLRGNLGDDLLFSIMAARYPSVTFHAYSDQSYDWFRILAPNLKIYTPHLKVSNKLFRSLIHVSYILSQARKCQTFIDLGGSIFMFVPSKNRIKNGMKVFLYSCYRNMLSFIFRDKFVIGANFGPFGQNKIFLSICTRYFKKCVDVCFRDEASYRMFKDLPNVRKSSDIAFSLRSLDTAKTKQVFVSLIDPSNEEEFSFTKTEQNEYVNSIFNTLLEMSERGYRIILSGFCAYQSDSFAVERLAKSLKEREVTCSILNYNQNLEEIVHSIAKSEYVLATRFHAAVLGIMHRCKTVPIVYSKKTTNMLNDIDFPRLQIVDIQTNMAELQKVVDGSYNFELKPNIREIAKTQFKVFDSYVGR